MSGSDDSEEPDAAGDDPEENSPSEEQPAPLSDLAGRLDDESTPSDASADSDAGELETPFDGFLWSENDDLADIVDEEVEAADVADADGEATDGRDVEDQTVDATGANDEAGEAGTVSAEELPHDADAEEAPLGRIAEEVQQRRERRDAEAESDLFEEVDVSEVDSDELWDTVFGEEETEESEGRAVGAGAEAEQVGTAPGADDRAEHRLPKEKYCQRCPYLSSPPMVACEHDGTEIVEVPDSEHFVVRGCPFAEQQDPDLQTFE